MAIRNNLDFFSFLIRPTIVRNVYEAGIIKTYALECENVIDSLPFYIYIILMDLILMINILRIWRPVSYYNLERLEKQVLKLFVHEEFEQTIVAGLGTIIFKSKVEEDLSKLPTLVLVHGYMAGNAMWVFVINRLSKHFR